MAAETEGTLRTWTKFIICFLKTRFVYRASLWIDLGFSFLFLLMQVYLWQALIGSGSVLDTTVKDMITYVVLSQVIRNCIRSGAAYTIEERLQSGNIAFDFIRPMSFRVQVILNDVGQAVSNLLLQSLPILITAIIFVGINPPQSIAHFLAFLLFTIGGLIISFYTSYIIGLIAFYTMQAKYIVWLIGTIRSFLSGQYLPLWLYPDWLRAIADLTPFKLMFYTPIAAYMGRIPLTELPTTFAVMFIWIAILITIEYLLWKKTTNQLVVQGG